MAEPKVLPPVEGPIFDDEDDILAGLDLGEEPQQAAPADHPCATTAAMARLAGEREPQSWLEGGVQFLPPCQPGTEWQVWPADAPFHGQPFDAGAYLAQPVVFPEGMGNVEKLRWLKLRSSWAWRRQRHWDEGRLEQQAAEEQARRAELDALAQTGAAPNAPPPPGRSGEDFYFGHHREILPPVRAETPPPPANRAVSARYRRRFNWNAIAAAVVAGMDAGEICARHGLALKMLNRAFARSARFRVMVEEQRAAKALQADCAFDNVIRKGMTDLMKEAIHEGDVRAATSLIRCALQITDRRERREVVMLRLKGGADGDVDGAAKLPLAPFGTGWHQLVPFGTQSPAKPQESVTSVPNKSFSPAALPPAPEPAP